MELESRNSYLEDYKRDAEVQWNSMNFTICEILKRNHALTEGLRKAKGALESLYQGPPSSDTEKYKIVTATLTHITTLLGECL